MAVIEYDEYKQKLLALEPALAELEKALFSGNFELASAHILPIILYSTGVTAIAII